MDPNLLSIALAALAILISFLLYKRLRFRLPPGPRALPVVGNLYDIKPVRFRCFAEWAQTYGPIMSVWFGTNLNVVVSTSDLAREVLKEHDQQLADRPRNRSTARFSRDGQDLIWADYGPHYVKVRKVCNLELFSPRRLEALRPIREEEVTAMVQSIFRECTQPGKIMNFMSLFFYYYYYLKHGMFGGLVKMGPTILVGGWWCGSPLGVCEGQVEAIKGSGVQQNERG